MDADIGSTRKNRHQPLLIVHTGDGKGKTTAAMGIALRSWANGDSVGVYQFIKSAKWRSGERRAFEALSITSNNPVEWRMLGQGPSWIRSKYTEEEKAQFALEGWRDVAQGLAEERHKLWLLDELTYPLIWGWVPIDEVAETLANRPGSQHVIVTGRKCPQEILDIADLVTEMKKIKHPFDSGQRAQAGIEW